MVALALSAVASWSRFAKAVPCLASSLQAEQRVAEVAENLCLERVVELAAGAFERRGEYGLSRFIVVGVEIKLGELGLDIDDGQLIPASTALVAALERQGSRLLDMSRIREDDGHVVAEQELSQVGERAHLVEDLLSQTKCVVVSAAPHSDYPEQEKRHRAILATDHG